jgi:ADP-ribose pyrophosphatase
MKEERVTPTEAVEQGKIEESQQKARQEKGAGYPQRQSIPNDKVSWEIEWPDYNPPYYVADVVLKNDRSINPKGWADPEVFTSYDELLKDKPREAYTEIKFSQDGKPLNPQGRTGISGRGLLGNWGPNNAADPIVTMIDESDFFRVAAIKRKDADARGKPDERALPGGMVDTGERITATLSRELEEETTANLDFQKAVPIYQGIVDDPRNTDNAWMVTDAYHLHLDGEHPDLEGADDAEEAGWFVVDEDFVKNMYASHANSLLKAITMWQKSTGIRLGKDGKVI